jgi:hypothetical protein
VIRHEHGANPRMRPLDLVIGVHNIVAEIDANPDLWNRQRSRTSAPKGPHREADDIWIRFNAWENFNPAEPRTFTDEHESVWYPEADKTPLLKAAVEGAAYVLAAGQIGGVLVTRVPAGKQIYWHTDSGWHAKAHRKFLVLLRGNREQSFEFENEQLYAEPGDCFEFLNEYPHRVLNPSAEERISLIICLRDNP